MEAVNEYDLVEPRYACTCCGERREDYLVWEDEDALPPDADAVMVKCASCGTVYDPNEE